MFKKDTFSFIFIAILTLPFVRMTSFYSHNQNTYFVKAFFKVGFLQNDWLANEESTTPEFDELIAFILKTFSSSAEYVFQFLFLLFILLFCYSLKMILNLFGTKAESFYATLLCAVLFFTAIPTLTLELLKLPVEFAQIPFNGLAGHNLISYFQPSIIGVLLITGIFLFLDRNYLFASLIILFTSIVHAPNILFAFLMMLFILYEVIIEKKWKLFFSVLLISIPFLGILIFKHLDFIDGKDELRALANEICINERSPHHHVISTWIKSESDWIRILWLLLGIWIFKGRLKKVYIFIGSIIFLLTIIQFYTNNQTLALIEPWRLTVVWVPLITAFIILRIIKHINVINNVSTKKYFIVVFLSLNLVALWFSSQPPLKRILNKDLFPLNGTLLIPPKGEWGERSETVRLNYLQPIFIDFKSHPYSSAGLIEWKERIDLANNFYENPTELNLQEILAKQKIDYVIWPDSTKAKPHFNYTSFVKSKGFVIYILRAATNCAF